MRCMYIIPDNFAPVSYLDQTLRLLDLFPGKREHPRRCQEKSNHVQYFGIAQICIIEAGGIDQDHLSPIEGEFIGEFYPVGT